MIEIRTFEKDLSADDKDVALQLIGTSETTLSPGDGEVFEFLEIGVTSTGKAKLEAFIDETRIIQADTTAMGDENHRTVVDWVLESGSKLSFKASDLSGSANTVKVTVVYNRKKKA